MLNTETCCNFNIFSEKKMIILEHKNITDGKRFNK